VVASRSICNSTHDRSGGQDEDTKVVESPSSLGQGETPTDHDQIGQQHGGEDGPKKVGSLVVDVLRCIENVHEFNRQ